MRQLNLQAPLLGLCPRAKNFEDQSGSVDDLGPGLVLQILLLHRGQRRIDDQQPGFVGLGKLGYLLDLALAEERRGSHRSHPERALRGDDDADRFGEPFRLLEPRLG
jgi:hypothetical protein